MNEGEAKDELFAAALDAFVETRTRLAAALAASGHKAEGQAVKKLRRPSPSAWATNQVVRRARADVDAFLEASDRLRESQAALVSGQGDRGVYQADVEALRRATAGLSEATRRILAQLGRPDDRTLVDRVVANARAAALTDAGRQALLDGTLVADIEGGVDAFGGLLGAAPAGAPAPRPAAARHPPPPSARPADARDGEHEAQRRDAEARERQRAAELCEARRDEGAAREAAAAAEAAATRARGAHEDARRRVEEAQEAARQAERALRDAEAALRSAQRDATEAETRAGRATRRREALER
jgi:hypothetical protein